MKTEVLSQSGKEHGFSVRQKAAGHVRRSSLAGRLRPASTTPSARTRLARTAAPASG